MRPGASTSRVPIRARSRDRKSTRLNSSHLGISDAVFCLKKKKQTGERQRVDAVSKADALHQQHTALAAEPGACQDSDALLLGGKHGLLYVIFFFFNDTATTEIYTLSLHDALPISQDHGQADLVQALAQCRRRGC